MKYQLRIVIYSVLAVATAATVGTVNYENKISQQADTVSAQNVLPSPISHPGTPADTAVSTGNAIRVGPVDIYPNPTTQPGFTNPDITQDNISQNICNHGWSTKSIRPPVSYTTPLKIKQITEYGYTDTNTKDYEEDHLISLELGGSPTDPRNLWPEPYNASIPDGGARTKDKVENFLHAQVCSGGITLQQAQQEISHDWYKVLKDNNL